MVSLLKLVLMTLSQIQTGEVSGGGEGGGSYLLNPSKSSQITKLKCPLNHQRKVWVGPPFELSKIFL